MSIHTKIKSFEEQFKAFVPHDMRVSSSMDCVENNSIKEYNSTGIIIKAIAYLIDLASIILVIPIILNVYHYLKWGQSIGQMVLGIRTYQYHSLEHKIGTLNQLIIRFIIKLLFLASRSIIGATMMTFVLGGEDMIINDPINKIVYAIIMIIWIHGYAISMYLNKDRRGLQDIISGTIVAYDYQGQQSKKILLGTILMICLWYLILVISPRILEHISQAFQGSRVDYYWSFRSRIDYWIIRGIYIFGLAN